MVEKLAFRWGDVNLSRMESGPAPSRRFVFHGNVQGVGFRWTTVRIARGLELRGYVRNLADGSVEVCAAGKDAALDELVRQLRGRFNVATVEAGEAPTPDLVSSFEVRR